MLHAGRGHIRIGRRYYQSLAVVVATASALPHLPLWDRFPRSRSGCCPRSSAARSSLGRYARHSEQSQQT
jgi:hypothetical protein